MTARSGPGGKVWIMGIFLYHKSIYIMEVLLYYLGPFISDKFICDKSLLGGGSPFISMGSICIG